MPGIVVPVALLAGIALLLRAVLGGRSSGPPAARSSAEDQPPTKELSPPSEIDVTDDEIVREIERETSRSRITRDLVKPPWSGVSDDQWWRFVKWAMQGKPDTITTSGNRGIFMLGIPTLVDLGMMKNHRRVTRDGRQVWEAEWAGPHSQESWNNDPVLQYDTWRRHVIRLADWLRSTWIGENVSGVVIDGVQIPIMFSGFLGGALRSGPSGLEKWLSTETKRNPATTKAVLATRDMFEIRDPSRFPHAFTEQPAVEQPGGGPQP